MGLLLLRTTRGQSRQCTHSLPSAKTNIPLLSRRSASREWENISLDRCRALIDFHGVIERQDAGLKNGPKNRTIFPFPHPRSKPPRAAALKRPSCTQSPVMPLVSSTYIKQEHCPSIDDCYRASYSDSSFNGKMTYTSNLVDCTIDVDTSSLGGKTAVITEGANGIGEAYVRALHGAG